MTHTQIDADTGALPELLVTPPWLRGKRVRPTVIAIEATYHPARLEWLPGEEREWAEAPPLRIATDEVWAQEIATAAMDPDYPLIEILADAPERLVRPVLDLLDEIELSRRMRWFAPMGEEDEPSGPLDSPHRRLLGRYGLDVAEFVMGAAVTQSGTTLWSPIVGSDVTATMVDWLERDDDDARATARAWFLRHPAAAALDLIPDALGKGVKARRQAESILWLLDKRGHREAILATAATYGAAVVTATEATLDRDPLLRLPTRIPKAPDWLVVGDLPRIRLRDSAQLVPQDAVEHLVSMLMMSGPDADYAGVPAVAAALDPATLGDFVWALYRAWVLAKYPAKRNMWPLRALGLLGNEETAAHLRTIAEGDRAVNRAAEALDLLALMATRNAHMHIQLAWENTTWPFVRERAATIIAELAGDLGISVPEFADRVVPDLGLNNQGTFTVDYGPRQFVVGLDDDLEPTVREPDGTMRESLPRPADTDDPITAPAAYAAYNAFKKSLRAAITDQSARLESAMVRRRTWTVAHQRALFIEHPLLRQLAQRLVWVAFDGDTQFATFHIDTDGTLADLDDARLELPTTATVSIAHPLHLGETIKSWSEIFADYGIVQPFPQLDRPGFAPDSPEFQAGLEPFRGTAVPTGKLLALNRFGWTKGYGENAATVRFTRTLLGATHPIRLEISPGIDARTPATTPDQTITSLTLPDNLTLTTLDPILASELLRELQSLR